MRGVFLALLFVAFAADVLGAPTTSLSSCADVPESARVDCTGGANVSHALCVERGCCPDDKTGTCYYSAPGKPIKTVHVICAFMATCFVLVSRPSHVIC